MLEQLPTRPLCLVLLAAPLALTFASPAAAQTGRARASYDVTFDATWSSATHPSAYPSSAHFSPLVGATHAPNTHLWEAGGLASVGMEVMAETGGTGPLLSEIDALITAGTAGSRITGPGIGAPDSATISVFVTEEFPAVTLVTMVAPSPDWFVGTEALSLFENDDWVETKVVPLYVWDAGTDTGPNFTSNDQDTNPQDPIAIITGGPFTGSDPIGTFTFTRRHTSVEYGLCANPEGSLRIAGGVRVGRTFSLSIDDPGASMPNPSLGFLSLSLGADASYPCGTTRPNWGMAAVGAAGALLQTNVQSVVSVGSWTGGPISYSLTVPNDMALIGEEFFAQGALVAPGTRVGLTTGIKMTVGR